MKVFRRLLIPAATLIISVHAQAQYFSDGTTDTHMSHVGSSAAMTSAHKASGTVQRANEKVDAVAQAVIMAAEICAKNNLTEKDKAFCRKTYGEKSAVEMRAIIDLIRENPDLVQKYLSKHGATWNSSMVKGDEKAQKAMLAGLTELTAIIRASSDSDK